jgi:hypothetical protein
MTLGTEDKLESPEEGTLAHHDWSDFHLQDVYSKAPLE